MRYIRLARTTCAGSGWNHAEVGTPAHPSLEAASRRSAGQTAANAVHKGNASQKGGAPPNTPELGGEHHPCRHRSKPPYTRSPGLHRESEPPRHLGPVPARPTGRQPARPRSGPAAAASLPPRAAQGHRIAQGYLASASPRATLAPSRAVRASNSADWQPPREACRQKNGKGTAATFIGAVLDFAGHTSGGGEPRRGRREGRATSI